MAAGSAGPSRPSSSTDSSAAPAPAPAPILVTSVEAARGLDFGGTCDCVLILGRVKTPDDYQHVAGRTGRRRTIAFGTARGGAGIEEEGGQGGGSDSGVVVSIISHEDARKLGAYESMLSIEFQRERGLDLDFI